MGRFGPLAGGRRAHSASGPRPTAFVRPRRLRASVVLAPTPVATRWRDDRARLHSSAAPPLLAAPPGASGSRCLAASGP